MISLLLLVANGSAAEGTVRIEDLDLAELLGTVSAASRKQQSILVTPAAVTVLDREWITRSGASSIQMLLRIVAGVQVVRNAPGNAIVSLRGMNGLDGNNVIVLLDGAYLNRRLDANVDWSTVPVTVDMLERIEIVRGPVSTLYGANAYTGVISLVTRREPGVEARASGTVATDGGRGALLGAAAANEGRAGDWHVAVHGGSDGTLAASRELGTIWPESGGVHPAWTGGGAVASATADLGTTRLFASAIAGRSTRSGIDHLAVEPNQLGNQMIQLAVGGEHLGPVATLSVRAETIHHTTTVITDEPGLGFGYGGTLDDEANTSADLALRPIDALELRVGGRVGMAYVQAPYLNASANERTLGFYGVWLNAEAAATPSLQLSAGVRLDDSAQLPNVQPSARLSAIHHRSRWSARLTVANGWREPSYIELASRFADPTTGLVLLEGNPALPPPRIRSIEAGVVAANRAGWTLQPTLFVQEVRHLVTEDFASLAWRSYGTANGAAMVGAELEGCVCTSAIRGRASVTALQWLQTFEGSATAGVPEQNAALTASVGADGSSADRVLAFGSWAAFGSSRRYDVVTGVPPIAIDAVIPPMLQLGGSVELRPDRARRLGIGLAASGTPNGGRVEGPLPWSAETGSRVGLFVRLDAARRSP